METKRICPSCNRPLAAGAPQGLCPECLMKAGFGTGVAPEPGEPTNQPPFTPPPLAEMAKLFPQLEIVELLGRGGMGAVYKARQPAIDRWVALKVLPPQSTARPGFAERFNREARALARLSHPNIVALYEFGQVGGMPYFVMEYVEGVTLRHLGQVRRLEPREALKIVPQICEALQFAHDEGVVHRDIKPENILLDKKGRVKIADFGIAKIMGGVGGAGSPLPAEATRAEGGAQGGARPATALTQDQVLGTPNYMAPEQVEHPQAVDHRADIYSLGVVFYEMLTGELPLGKFQPPSKKVQVDVRLDEVVLHALEKEPELRYQQASQVKTAVETIALASPPPPAPSPYVAEAELNPWQPAILMLAALAALVGLLVAPSLPHPLGLALSVIAGAGLIVTGLKLAGVWPFPSPGFPKSSFTGRNLRRRNARSPVMPPVQPVPGERRGACFFSTPERMRHCFPSAAAQIYICRGELRLAPDALTFLTPWQTRIGIPLSAIEELSVGQFQMWTTPWVMQYERVNFLAVTYRQDGRRQTVHLTPVPAGATSAQQINEHIGGWFEAIEQARLAQQGVTARVTQPGAVLISAEPAWNKKGVPLFVALLAATGLMVWRFRAISGPVPEPLGMALFGTLFLLLMALIWFSVGFLRANYALRHGDLEAVTSNEPPEGLRFGLSGPEPKLPEFFWVTAARWSARLLGTLLLAILALFVMGEGLPPMGPQPEGVQLSFAAVGLMALGLIIGWKREGMAALLIASGWTLWHIAEGRISLNAFQAPLPVAALYGFYWWATHGRKTLVVLATAVGLAAVLAVGLWLCPSSVFVRGTVRDALSGAPIPNAELTLPRRAQSPHDQGQRPNARADLQGRFALYVGWYVDQKPVTVAAAGYAPLTTNLGPRALGQRTVSRDFQLQPADGSRRTSEGMRRKFVRLVVDPAAMTFEGQPTTWEQVSALLGQVPDRTNTVLECAVTSDQITVQQQNEWTAKCQALAHTLGFEYASFIGIHPLGSKGTREPDRASGGTAGASARSEQAPVAQAASGTFRLTLTNGVSVEVVAVTRNPLANKLWWKPDGTPLPQPPGARVIFQPAGMWKERDVVEEAYAVLVRCDPPTGAAAGHWQYGLEHTPRAERLGRLEIQQGNRMKQAAEELERLGRKIVGGVGGPGTSSQVVGYADVVRFPAGTEQVALQCASAAGPWEPVAVFDGKQTRVLLEGVRVLCTYLRQESNGKCLDVTHDTDREQYALRMIGVFKDGKREELVFHSGVLSGRETQGFVLLEPGQRVENIAEFVLERTPWVRGEIRDIALKPVASAAANLGKPTPQTMPDSGQASGRGKAGKATSN